MIVGRRSLSKGLLTMGVLEALGLRRPAQAAIRTESVVAAPPVPKSVVAQLVGTSWIVNMNDPGYGLESHLPKLLNAGPDGVSPKKYKSVSRLSGEFFPRGRFYGDKSYVRQLTASFSFVVSHYNATVEDFYGTSGEKFHMFMWKGVRMNGLPVVTGFTAERTEEDIREIWDGAYNSYGLTSKPVLTIASGNSGWTTLEAGLALLPSPESKVIWETTVDLPSYPKEDAPNEAAVLLMLGHPATDTGREPLAYLTRPQVRPVKDAQLRHGETRRVAALREAVEAACSTAGIEPNAIGSVATDCGRNTPAAAKRLSEVGAALFGLVSPEIDLVHQRIDMAALLGELGENTVNTTLVLATYAAYQRNHPVLYVSNVDPDAGRAMLVLPPPGHVPPDAGRKFREHNAMGQWYAPWWGRRLDGRLDY